MWSSRLFWKLFIGYTALTAGALFVLWFVLSGWHEQQVTAQILRDLRNSAILLRSNVIDHFQNPPSETVQDRVSELSVATGTRFTLVDMRGIVLADSEKATLAEIAQMENHSARQELVDAIRNGVGQSQRFSPTLRTPMQYFAVRADVNGQPVGLVRAAVPLTAIDREVRNIRRLFGVLVLLAAIAMLLLTYWIVSRIIRPVQKLTLAAKGLSEGKYEHDVTIETQDELGVLGGVFQQMSSQISRRVAQLRESEARLATVLGGMAEGVIAVDDKQAVLFANSAAGELLSFDASVAERRRFVDVIRQDQLHQLATDCLAQNNPHPVELELKGITDRMISVSATRLPGTPCPGILLVLHDVSELRRLESMRQAFVANVSHELKTPLSSIKAFAETLRPRSIA